MSSHSPKSTFHLPLHWDLLPQQDKLMLAVSGGADSMALLHAVSIANVPFNIVVAHINHGTRGDENDADAAFVKEFCDRNQLIFDCQHLRLTDHSEAALRTARYAALLKMAHAHHCQRVATAHTANDVLESLLLNFLRDASILGWSGIAQERALDAKVLLVRPLLQTSRQQIHDYLARHHQAWREDSSNKSTFYKRNALRQQLLPVLDQLVPLGLHQLAKQASRTALLARDENHYWNELVHSHWQQLILEETPALVVWDGSKFQQLHAALQRRLLRQAVQHFCSSSSNLAFQRVEEVRNHITLDNRNAVWQWRDGITIHWTGAHSGRRIRITRTGC